MENKKSSHLGAGLAAGAILGLAAGFFLQSKKGKELTKDAQKKAMQLQKQVMKKLEGVEEMTKAKYLEIVDDVIAYYEKTKEVAKSEIPVVKKYLVSRWADIEKSFKAK